MPLIEAPESAALCRRCLMMPARTFSTPLLQILMLLRRADAAAERDAAVDYVCVSLDTMLRHCCRQVATLLR